MAAENEPPHIQRKTLERKPKRHSQSGGAVGKEPVVSAGSSIGPKYRFSP
jgi:hypothetical protein